MNRALRRCLGMVVALTTVVTVSACGDDASTTSTTSAAAGGASAGASAANPDQVVVPGIRPLSQLYKGESVSPPTTGPKPQAGKSVWVITCTAAVAGCQDAAVSAKEAGDSIGWNVTLFDGKYNEGGAWATGINNAIAAQADVIVPVGIPCSAVQQPLQQAKDAGIIILSLGGTDCDPAVFTTNVIYSDYAKSNEEFDHRIGVLGAEYAIDATGGSAQLLTQVGRAEPFLKLVDQGFEETLAKCPNCKILNSVEYGSSDLVPNGPWIQAFRSQLLQNPDANAIYLQWDVMGAELGGVQAVREAGSDAIVFGGQGSNSSLELIRNGDLAANTAAWDLKWWGYTAIDTANRVLNGQEPVAQGLDFVLIDKDHNMPPPGESYSSAVDWKAAYQKSWGVAG